MANCEEKGYSTSLFTGPVVYIVTDGQNLFYDDQVIEVPKGKKAMHITHSINTTKHPYSVLGCWIINHEFEATRNNDLVDINGEFEVNIWYSTEENSRTDVLREKVAYKKDIKVKRIVNEYLKNSDDVLAKY